MSTFGKIIGWLLGLGIVVGGGIYLLGSREPDIPPGNGEPWLTEYEAYEDQTAHTGMDGGAFVVPGLRIRDPRDVSATEGHTPAHYALNNGTFETLQSGEVVYRRLADGMLRRSVWAKDGDGRLKFVDESGCVARNIYAFDGYYAGSDGIWDESVPRLDTDTRPVPGQKYRKEDNPTEQYLEFEETQDGQFTVLRRYPSLDHSESYRLEPFGRGAYALEKKEDPEIRAYIAVLPDGKTVLFSQAGERVKFVR